MNNKLKFWMNVIIFMDILIIILSGFLLWKVLPYGIWLYKNFIFSKEQWMIIYNLSGILLIIVSIIRISLDFIQNKKLQLKLAFLFYSFC